MSFKKNSLPTMQQLQYLTELETIEPGTGLVMRVAKRCGTTHGPVSRYFKSCIECGILTEQFDFTDLGIAWLRSYQRLIAELRGFLQAAELPEETIERNVTVMIENIDQHTLQSMMTERHGNAAFRQKGNVRQELDNAIEENGACRVNFWFYRVEDSYRGDRMSSMANRGFSREACLRSENGRTCLELITCEMRAHSRVDQSEMTGRLQTIKYNDNGTLREAKITPDRKLLLPLYAFRLTRTQSGEITGYLMVTVTCSVGEQHMPESTAMLTIWA